MIAGERTTAYINSLDMGNTELLNQIEAEAKKACVPIIRQEMQSLLKTLLALKKPAHILEVRNSRRLFRSSHVRVRRAGYAAYYD